MPYLLANVPLSDPHLKHSMPFIFVLLTFFTALCLQAQDHSVYTNYSVLHEVITDVDGDGQAETLKVVQYGQEKDKLQRQIQLYQNIADTLSLWQLYDSAILSSGEGGVMGDPFSEFSVNDSSLSISHYGGSSWRWSLIDDYVFRNGEYILVHHSSSFSKVCEYSTDFSINLDSGQAHYQTKAEYCDYENTEAAPFIEENEDFILKGLEVLMNNRFETNRIITSPVHGYKMDL